MAKKWRIKIWRRQIIIWRKCGMARHRNNLCSAVCDGENSIVTATAKQQRRCGNGDGVSWRSGSEGVAK